MIASVTSSLHLMLKLNAKKKLAFSIFLFKQERQEAF